LRVAPVHAEEMAVVAAQEVRVGHRREGRWIDAAILDRIDITAQGRRHILLITRCYGTPGETGLDRYLSR
jgi:hypothetical protein